MAMRTDEIKSGEKSDVTAQLRAAIIMGRFMPNQRLLEIEIAGMFSTNRANIRTAFAVLEGEGLVVREPNRGARVRRIDGAEALQIVEVRGVLEGLVARQAAEKAGEPDRRVLRSIVGEMQDAVERLDVMTCSALNSKLHREIQRIAGNATVNKLLAGLRSQVVRLQFQTIVMPGRVNHAFKEHAAIVEAICAGDPNAAEQAMRRHLESVSRGLRQVIETADVAIL